MIVFSAHTQGAQSPDQDKIRNSGWCVSRTNGISLVDRAVTTNVAGALFVLVLAVFLARLRGARNFYRPSEWTGASSNFSLFRRKTQVSFVSRFV